MSGGASGLGRATVNRFIEKGASVVFCDLPTSDGATVAAEIGPNATYVPADIRSAQDISNVMAEIQKRHGKLNIVVNCAGIGNAHIAYNFVKGRPRNLADFDKIWKVRQMHSQLFGEKTG